MERRLRLILRGILIIGNDEYIAMVGNPTALDATVVSLQAMRTVNCDPDCQNDNE